MKILELALFLLSAAQASPPPSSGKFFYADLPVSYSGTQIAMKLAHNNQVWNLGLSTLDYGLEVMQTAAKAIENQNVLRSTGGKSHYVVKDATENEQYLTKSRYISENEDSVASETLMSHSVIQPAVLQEK